jgi:hypothetical protein
MPALPGRGGQVWYATSLAELLATGTDHKGPQGEILAPNHIGVVLLGTGYGDIQSFYTCNTVAAATSSWTAVNMSLPGNLSVGGNLSVTGTIPVHAPTHAAGGSDMPQSLQIQDGGADFVFKVINQVISWNSTGTSVDKRAWHLVTWEADTTNTSYETKLSPITLSSDNDVGLMISFSQVTKASAPATMSARLEGSAIWKTGGTVAGSQILTHHATSGGSGLNVRNAIAGTSSLNIQIRSDDGSSYRGHGFVMTLKGDLS